MTDLHRKELLASVSLEDKRAFADGAVKGYIESCVSKSSSFEWDVMWGLSLAYPLSEARERDPCLKVPLTMRAYKAVLDNKLVEGVELWDAIKDFVDTDVLQRVNLRIQQGLLENAHVLFENAIQDALRKKEEWAHESAARARSEEADKAEAEYQEKRRERRVGKEAPPPSVVELVPDNKLRLVTHNNEEEEFAGFRGAGMGGKKRR